MAKYSLKLLSVMVLLLLSIFCLGLYFNQFNGVFSEKQQDWGAFGSYVSGTIGVFSACLAVLWLIRSVTLQQVELQHLKDELKSSSTEQKNQTHIGALTALLTSNQQALANEKILLAKVTNENSIDPMDLESRIHTSIVEDRIDVLEKEIGKL
ncbi:hypothetical protein DS893_12085 [Vibrionales bacterium C3R12]|nr:hypothetical protein DS893_12085 [Vibrionales bacterium C3R12]